MHTRWKKMLFTEEIEREPYWRQGWGGGGGGGGVMGLVLILLSLMYFSVIQVERNIWVRTFEGRSGLELSVWEASMCRRMWVMMPRKQCEMLAGLTRP